jgi:hypothetical protein
MRAEHNGLLLSSVARDMLDRLAAVADPTALELELDSAGVPHVYIPASS